MSPARHSYSVGVLVPAPTDTGDMKPKTRFVRNDGIKIGYQVFGDGPVDLLFVHGVVSHIDLMWGDPAYAPFMNRLGSFARVITFDRRGVGFRNG